jgi:hypothetical protein
MLEMKNAEGNLRNFELNKTTSETNVSGVTSRTYTYKSFAAEKPNGEIGIFAEEESEDG